MKVKNNVDKYTKCLLCLKPAIKDGGMLCAKCRDKIDAEEKQKKKGKNQ